MKKRVQVTLDPVLISKAEGIMETEGFSSLSAFLEQLIREESRRRGLARGPVSYSDTGPSESRMNEDKGKGAP